MQMKVHEDLKHSGMDHKGWIPAQTGVGELYAQATECRWRFWAWGARTTMSGIICRNREVASGHLRGR